MNNEKDFKLFNFLRKSLIAAGLTGLLAASPAAAQSTFQVPVNKNFQQSELDWGGEFGKGYVYTITIIDNQGKLAVCGAGYYPSSHTRIQSKKAMRKLSITLNGKKILTDLSFFTEVKAGSDLTRATATCKMTSAATPKGKADIQLKGWARGSF